MPILVHRCPHCLTDEMNFSSVALIARDERAATAFFECKVCRKPVGAWFSQTKQGVSNGVYSAMTNWPGTFDSVGWSLIELWPADTAPDAPDSLPPAIKRNFLQATEAARRDHREAAGMTYRRALELALKDKAPDLSGTFYKRIEAMSGDGRLTKDVAEWAHSVRTLGNDAAHEDVEPTTEDIVDLAAFTRVVLEYLYTMPTKVLRRSATPARTATDSSAAQL